MNEKDFVTELEGQYLSLHQVAQKATKCTPFNGLALRAVNYLNVERELKEYLTKLNYFKGD